MPFKGLSDEQLLALTIYGEARGESRQGKEAVAHVILNRVKEGGWYGDSVERVCLKPWQFSCFLKNDPNYVKLVHQALSGEYDEECLDVARKAIAGESEDPTGHATHYHAASCKASWAKSMRLTKVIGHHRFYR